MKSFIRNSVIFFVLGVVATVAVFYLISKNNLTPNDFSNAKTAEQTVIEVAAQAKQVQETIEKVPDTGIPLSSVALSERQKFALQTVGIDTQSFVVTKAMVACSVEKLGLERTQVLLGGQSPSLMEITTLTPCLKSS